MIDVGLFCAGVGIASVTLGLWRVERRVRALECRLHAAGAAQAERRAKAPKPPPAPAPVYGPGWAPAKPPPAPSSLKRTWGDPPPLPSPLPAPNRTGEVLPIFAGASLVPLPPLPTEQHYRATTRVWRDAKPKGGERE